MVGRLWNEQVRVFGFSMDQWRRNFSIFSSISIKTEVLLAELLLLLLKEACIYDFLICVNNDTNLT